RVRVAPRRECPSRCHPRLGPEPPRLTWQALSGLRFRLRVPKTSTIPGIRRGGPCSGSPGRPCRNSGGAGWVATGNHPQHQESYPMDLFSPHTLGVLELPNRLVMAPLTRSRSCTDGVPNDDVVEYYRQRASMG